MPIENIKRIDNHCGGRVLGGDGIQKRAKVAEESKQGLINAKPVPWAVRGRGDRPFIDRLIYS